MLKFSNKIFPHVAVGDAVKVLIPDVDRDRTNTRNLLCVVVFLSNAFYALGTKQGEVKQHFTKNQSIHTMFTYLFMMFPTWKNVYVKL